MTSFPCASKVASSRSVFTREGTRTVYRVPPEIAAELARECIYVEQERSGKEGARRRPLFDQMKRERVPNQRIAELTPNGDEGNYHPESGEDSAQRGHDNQKELFIAHRRPRSLPLLLPTLMCGYDHYCPTFSRRATRKHRPPSQVYPSLPSSDIAPIDKL